MLIWDLSEVFIRSSLFPDLGNDDMLITLCGNYFQPKLNCFIHMTVYISDEHEGTQKKTFTKWINAQLAKVQCTLSCTVYCLFTSIFCGLGFTQLFPFAYRGHTHT